MVALVKVANETVQSSEATNRLQDQVRVDNDTVQVAEAENHELGFVEEAAVETMQIGETAAKIVQSTFFDSALFLDTLAVGWLFEPGDTVTLTDSVTIDLGFDVTDVLVVTDSVAVEQNLTIDLDEAFSILDQAKDLQLFIEAISDSFDLADTVAETVSKIELLVDQLKLIDSLQPEVNYIHELNETLQLVDTLGSFWEELIDEDLTMVDSIVHNLVMSELISDAVDLADAILAEYFGIEDVVDTGDFTDAVSDTGSLLELVFDGFSLDTTIILDGAIFQCWAVTTNQFNISSYSGFDFNSYAVLDNQVYGAKDDGIYLLEGSTDDGAAINTGLMFVMSSLKDLHPKKFRSVYVGGSGERIVLKVETENDGDFKYYQVVKRQARIRKDQEGRRWIFSLEGIEKLDSMEFVPLLLARKRRN